MLGLIYVGKEEVLVLYLSGSEVSRTLACHCKPVSGWAYKILSKIFVAMEMVKIFIPVLTKYRRLIVHRCYRGVRFMASSLNCARRYILKYGYATRRHNYAGCQYKLRPRSQTCGVQVLLLIFKLRLSIFSCCTGVGT